MSIWTINWTAVVGFFVLGLLVGSFLNVLIWRIPRGESIVYPRSYCPKCGTSLSPINLIPVVSYIIQNGRCSKCHSAISWLYPVVELLTGVLFSIGAAMFGIQQRLIPYLVLVSYLLVLSLVDLEHKILPDVLTLSGLVLGLIFSLLGWTIPFVQSAAGAVIGGGVLLLVAILSRGGMGMGDVKLMLMIGAFTGWQGSLTTLFVGSLLGVVIGGLYLLITKKGRRTPIPFGPFLAVGAVFTTVYLYLF